MRSINRDPALPKHSSTPLVALWARKEFLGDLRREIMRILRRGICDGEEDDESCEAEIEGDGVRGKESE